ncbi:MAG TPA: DinB family protein [Thermoanaerobaculia bacterium]|nr:DinB family protein [Thermoanaerobaculia bacterium]
MGSSLAGRPGAEEYAPFYQGYIDRVPGDDPVIPLGAQATTAIKFLRNVPEEKREYAYAPGKWTTRQVVSHLIDSELVFSYRALRISRRDPQPLAGFDEKAYVEYAELGDRPYGSLVEELELLRRANVARFSHLSPPSWTRLGEANGHRVSVRALAFIMAGHLEHHLEILRQRYGIS